MLVHLTSASLYPVFPWLRDRMARRVPTPENRRFARAWSGLAAAGLCGLGILAFFGWQGREPPHLGGNVAFDQAYMRRMAAHHAQGAELALLAAERAEDSRLRSIARLMVAEQHGEIAIFRRWWHSWFDGTLPAATAEDHAAMPGMVPPEQVEALKQSGAGAFDARFVALMTHHHQGAVVMADEAFHKAGDRRLRLMSHAIRHEQRGEVELMRGTRGFAAVWAAVLNLLLPAAHRERTRMRPGRSRPWADPMRSAAHYRSRQMLRRHVLPYDLWRHWQVV
jgi:uncharacterized protein (DUF305 family)